jgi:hypothetical protein
VDIEIYRTINSGSTFYLIGSVQNLRTASTVSYADTAADASILVGEPLYQQAGVKANQSPVSLNAMTFWNNRFFGISAENPREVWYSKLLVDGQGVAFSDQFTVEADEDLTGLIGMDDKLILFGSEGAHVLTGDGPDNLGTGLYANPFRLAHRVGLIYPRALTAYEQGVAMRSEVGVQMLDRGLNLIDIGAPVVDETDGKPIVQAEVIPGEQRIEWIMSDGKVLVWDWYHQQWYVGWTGLLAAVAGTFVRSESATYFIGANGSLLKTGTQYQSSWTFTTAWIKFSALGYERLKRALLLGEFLARHTIACTVYYDYDDDTGETGHTVDTNDITPAPVAGRGMKVDIRPNREKCEAIKFKFVFTSSGGADETQRPWAMAFDVGVKPGVARYNTTARI